MNAKPHSYAVQMSVFRSYLQSAWATCAIVSTLLLAFGHTRPAEAKAAQAATLAAPGGLNCQHQVQPLAVSSQEIRLAWLDQPTRSSLRNLQQSAYRLLVASSLTALVRNQADVWDSGKVLSNATTEVAYAGKPLQPLASYYWKVMVWDKDGKPSAWSAPSYWTVAPGASDWKALWIADAPDSTEAESAGRQEGDSRPMPVFRTAFHLRKQAVRAMLYISGLGQYEAHLNGQKVGDSQLTPGWTNYGKTVPFNTYDVTALLHPGSNAIGVMLGNGMYNVRKTDKRYTKLVNSFGQPKCIVALRLSFADGSSQWINSGPEWKTTSGPIRFSSTYGGEDFDTRTELSGWDSPDFQDASWNPAIPVNGPGGLLIPETIPPIRIMHTYKPVSQKQIAPNTVVFDFGQNFAGWPKIITTGRPGASVKLIPGELLNPDGTVSQLSSGAPQWFTYTLRGAGKEVWQPRFSYYGFRYLEVETSPSPSAPADLPIVSEVEGEAVHSSAEETGTFATSNDLLNRTHLLILQAMRNNIESLLTDCPHREKLGWLEETHLLGSALNYDFDLQQIYEKLSHDISDAQEPGGRVPEIAPRYVTFEPKYDVFNDSPEWGSAVVLDPWIAYQRYGSVDALRNNYAQMQAYIEYLSSRAQRHIINYGLGDWYDIGPGAPGLSKLTTQGLTATAIYYQDLRTMAQIARLLDNANDAEKYAELAENVQDAFNARFYDHAEHNYDRGSQTANAMPLVVGLVPKGDEKNVLNHLVANIRAHDNHVTAGDIGYHYVVDALLEGDRSDVLMDMLSRTDSPSYGYQLSKGATALTEAWDANPRSSQDHFMLGDAEEWFYRGLGGINVDLSLPADRQITIYPAFPQGVPSVRCTYHSVKGLIESSWKRIGNRLTIDITLPPNVVGELYLPASASDRVQDSSVRIGQISGITFVRAESGSLVYRLNSGAYQFSIPAP